MTLIGNDTNSTGVWQGLIRRYAKHLPVDDSTPIVSLLEGNTPLIRADRLAREIGGDIELHLKYEGLNPTASFKDRGMTMAVSKAMERGAEVVVCASTGNTSASAAAYAARAGIKVRRAAATRQDRAGQTGAGADARRDDDRDRGQF